MPAPQSREPPSRTVDPATTAAQLGGTRFLVLAGVLSCERYGEGGPPCGRDVLACLEAQCGLDLDRGIYPHLDALAEAGLVVKQPARGTANSYQTTETGMTVVRGAAEWLAWVLGADMTLINQGTRGIER